MDPIWNGLNRPLYGVPRSRQHGRVRFRWKDRAPTSWSFFCPLCRTTRTLASQPRLVPRHLLQVALTTIIFMLATWSWFEWKGIVAFVPFWAVFELVFRSRQRIALKCPHCGFDPYLYLVDIQQAREQIENHWRKKFSEKGIPFPEKDRPEVLSSTSNPNRQPATQSQPGKPITDPPGKTEMVP